MAIIAKGNQRGSGRQLAAHLLNARDNERVEAGDMRGTAATDLAGAFAEWELQAKATRAQQAFYHLSVSPDHSQAEWTEADYYAFLDRAEERLGLQGQPRAVVFHVKEGRHHCHCVWSRIDVELGRAVHLSKDRMKLRSLVQEVALERGLELPDGLKHDKGAERTGGKHTKQAEQKQQERSGQTKAERVAILTAAWQEHPDAGGFVEAMERAGFTLARGNGQQRKAGKVSQPVYVVIDRAGEVHSLARQIEGAKSKEIFTRLGSGYALDSLESVEAVKVNQQREREGQQQQRTVGNEFNYAAGQDFAREVISPPPSAKQQDYKAGQDFAREQTQTPTIDQDVQTQAAQDAIDSAAIAYAEQRRQEFHQTQATDRATFERHGEEMTARHAATWGETIHRHAVELSEAASVAPTSYQPGTMAEAEQAASWGLSFALGLAASVGDSFLSLISPARRNAKQRREAERPNKRTAEQAQQDKRHQQLQEAHSREMEAMMQEQARERASYEQRRALMLFQQAGALQSFEQAIGDKSSMLEAFEKHTEQVESYRTEIGRMAARKEARQERERGGPELEL